MLFKPNKASYLLPGLSKFTDKMKETSPVSVEVKEFRFFQSLRLFVRFRGTQHQVLGLGRDTLRYQCEWKI